MFKFISKQKIARSILIVLAVFIWESAIYVNSGSKATLFCYTRDELGNKALVKDNGIFYVEDTFIMEIPKEEFKESGNSTITVIMEDESGNQKRKVIRLYPKEH